MCAMFSTQILLAASLLLIVSVSMLALQHYEDLKQSSLNLYQSGTLARAIHRTVEPHTVLLIRGYTLVGNSVLERVSRYAKECAQTTPPIDVWLSLDTTKEEGQLQVAQSYFRKVGATVHLDTFNDTEIFRRFPSLWDAHRKQHRDIRNWEALTSGFQSEYVISWYMDRLKNTTQYQSIWVFEADVEYSGLNISDLLYDPTYANTTMDLVTQECTDLPYRWWHERATTRKYRDFLLTKRYYSVEAAHKFSLKYLHAIQGSILQGMHARSEEFLCSIARKLNYTVVPFKSHHMGTPYTHSSDKVGKF
eukprot:m.609288 g.609288  ORF g.609288 m.609288 type:complete len:306 (-) comp22488_c0_seq63:3051-3968(-)